MPSCRHVTIILTIFMHSIPLEHIRPVILGHEREKKKWYRKKKNIFTKLFCGNSLNELKFIIEPLFVVCFINLKLPLSTAAQTHSRYRFNSVLFFLFVYFSEISWWKISVSHPTKSIRASTGCLPKGWSSERRRTEILWTTEYWVDACQVYRFSARAFSESA